MEKSEVIKNVIASLVKFNLEVTKIAKDAKNPFLKNNYSTLDQIIDQVRPILASHGLIVMQDVSSQQDGYITVKTSVMHESGEYIQSSGTTIKLTKNDAQGVGASTTYARRYDLTAMLSLNTGDDDDGNSASGKYKEQPAGNKKYTPKKQVATKQSNNKSQPNKQSQSSKTNNKTQTTPPMATMSQQSEIEKLAKEYVKLKGKGTVQQILEHFNIGDLKLISQKLAAESIAKLLKGVEAERKKVAAQSGDK